MRSDNICKRIMTRGARPLSTARHLLLAIVFTTTVPAPVNSEWEYIEPMFACSPTISKCGPSSSHTCLANPNHPQSTTDDECAACQTDQRYWPCDVDGLCYCWDHNAPKIPPAPSTRTYDGGKGLNVSNVDPCELLTEEVFKTLAPMAYAPYSYGGFCAAVRKYNENHPAEGVFNMGTVEMQKYELAAFLGNALHESDEFRAGREYLMCADRLEMGGEIYCRPCDASSFDWDNMKCPEGASLASEGRAFNSYCQSNLLPPEGCECDDVYERAESGPMAGYVKANQVYFGRGSIQLSWNYNYIRASVALTGAPQTFCQRPDLVATNEEYAWGAGLFYWMENIKNGMTCHQSVLLNDEFGETLDNINGGLECPADDHGWHGKAIVLRLNRYCRAASAVGVSNLLSLDGCIDMDRRMKQCLADGSCKDCKAWEDKLKLGQVEEVAANSTASDGGSGKKKDKNKNKNGQNDGGATKGDKKKQKEQQKLQQQKQQQQQQQQTGAEDSGKVDASAGAASAGEDGDDAAAATSLPEPTISEADSGNAVAGAASSENKDRPVAAVETSTPEPSTSPSSPPTAQPTAARSTPYTASESSAGPCTGEPCQIPEYFDKSVEICRSSQGVCGAGSSYCNDRSTWTPRCDRPAAAVVPSAAARPSPLTDWPTWAPAVTTSADNEEEGTYRPTDFPTPMPNRASSALSSSASNWAASQFAAPTPPILEYSHGKNSDGPPSDDYSAASQFAIVPSSAREPVTVAANRPAVSALASLPEPANLPLSQPSSHASQFATATHSKGHNNPVVIQQQTVMIQPRKMTIAPTHTMLPTTYSPTTPIPTTETPTTESPTGSVSKEPDEVVSTSYAAQFGSMTNWANTKLEYPPSGSPVLATPAPDGSTYEPTPMPTKFPTKKPAKVINIADAYHQQENSSGDKNAADESEEEMPAEQLSVGMAESEPAFLPPAEGDALSPQQPEQQSPSFFTKLNSQTYLFSPMDDVTISRSYPTTNFGHDPTVAVDMVEGDATLLRFDLSAVGDATIKKATLQLTSRAEEEDGLSGTTAAAGKSFGSSVFYIQPVANGWTENEVTYDTAPKSNGSLFASVARRPSGSDDNVGDVVQDDGRLELSVTQAAANHVISFRIVGTDRIRNVFASKESIREEDAPVLVVDLDPMTKMSAVEEEASSMVAAGGGAVEMAGTSEEKEGPATKPSETLSVISTETLVPPQQDQESSSSSSFGRISGHVWLDRNSDGLQDSTEPGLRGVLVDLYDCDDGKGEEGNDGNDGEGQWIEGTRTAAGGDYMFDGLEEGHYYVVVTPGSNLGFSLKNEVSENGDSGKLARRSSGVDPSTGRGDCVELSSSGKQQLMVSVNAGIVNPAITPSTSSESTTNLVEDPAQPEDSPASVAVAALSQSDSDTGSDSDEADSSDPNCRGKPCAQEDGDEGQEYCRSKYNFCGAGEEYCNDDSRWKPECGTPSPTEQPSLTPTTLGPTFVFDLDVQCAGEPCSEDEDDGTWCRSELGYCGSGPLYCNSYSSWIPQCVEEDNNATKVGGDNYDSDNVTDSPTVSPSSNTTRAPTLEGTASTSIPTLSPTTKDVVGFSPFVLPTLSQVVTPKITDITNKAHNGGSGAAKSDEDDEQASFSSTVESNLSVYASVNVTELSLYQPDNTTGVNAFEEGQDTVPPSYNGVEDTPWYIKFADVEPIERNAGSGRSPLIISAGVFFVHLLCSAIILCIST